MKNLLTILILVGLILLSAGGTYVALNYQTLFPLNYLTADYFVNDTAGFKGLTLPFPENTQYSAEEVAINQFVYVDFKVPTTTVITAAIPGTVTIVTNSVNYNVTYIYIKHPAENFYVIYTISNTSSSVLVKVDDTVQRGQRIAVVRTPLSIPQSDKDTLLRLAIAKTFKDITDPLPVTLYLKPHAGYEYYWPDGEPKYFRG